MHVSYVCLNTCFYCESLMIGCVSYCEYAVFVYLVRKITLIFDVYI